MSPKATLWIERLLSSNWDATPNLEFRQTVSTDQLGNGAYFYRLINGEEQKVGRLIISK